MNPWVQALLGLCGVVMALATVLFRTGQTAGEDSGALKRIDERLAIYDREILSLRDWRHSQGNAQQVTVAIDQWDKRIERLERRVFNGEKR